jgi:glycosyltransferase involved in cell wall biosynthesis
MCEGPNYHVTAIVVADTIVRLEDCLSSLRADAEHAEATAGYRTLICVVDNASADGVQAWVTEHYPRAVALRTDDRLGYASAHNLGLAIAQDASSYFLLLSPDTQTPPGLISGLVDGITSRCSYGLVQPLQYAYTPGDRTLGDLTGDSQRLLQYDAKRIFRHGSGTEAIEDAYFGGTALFGAMAMIGKIGRFDDTYQTDVAVDDLAYRAGLANWRSAVLTGYGVQRYDDPGRDDDAYSDEDCRDELYYLACTKTRYHLSLQDKVWSLGWQCRALAASLREYPRETLTTGLEVLAARAWLARRWPRVMARRRAARRLVKHPSWNRAQPEPANPVAARS